MELKFYFYVAYFFIALFVLYFFRTLSWSDLKFLWHVEEQKRKAIDKGQKPFDFENRKVVIYAKSQLRSMLKYKQSQLRNTVKARRTKLKKV